MDFGCYGRGVGRFLPYSLVGRQNNLEGEAVALTAPPEATSNPVAYFVDCIRHDKTIEDPLSTQLNVQVMDILDAARESARTGRKQGLR